MITVDRVYHVAQQWEARHIELRSVGTSCYEVSVAVDPLAHPVEQRIIDEGSDLVATRSGKSGVGGKPKPSSLTLTKA